MTDEVSYGPFIMMYVPHEDGSDPEDSGLYVKLHEVIAMLRYEALMVEQGIMEGEKLEDCLHSIADAFAEQAVEAMESIQGDL